MDKIQKSYPLWPKRLGSVLFHSAIDLGLIYFILGVTPARFNLRVVLFGGLALVVIWQLGLLVRSSPRAKHYSAGMVNLLFSLHL